MAKKPTYEELERRFKELENETLECKRAEEALRESEQQYRTIGETIPYGVWLTDATGYCTYVSNSFLELTDMSLEQIQEFGWLHLLPPEAVEPTKEHWLHCVETGEDFDREHQFRAKDGNYRNVLAIGRPIKNDTGKIVKWVGLNLDITERKQAEEAILKSEEKYRSLVESTEDSIYLVDRDGTYLFVNEKHLSRLGSPVDKVIGRTYGEFHPIDDTKEFEGKIEELFETGQTTQHEHRSLKDDRYFLRTLSPVKGPDEDTTSVTVVSKDITERKQAEETLRESEERFNAMFEHMGSGVAVYEPFHNGEDFVVRAFNSAAEGIARISRNEALGNRLLDLFPHMDESGLLGALRRVWKTGEAEHLPTFYYKDEIREGWRENRIYKLPSGEIVALFDDVTDRKKAEEALRESEEKYRTILASIEDGYYELDIAGNFTFCNDSMCRIVGYPNDELMGMNNREYMDQETAKNVYQSVNRVYTTGKVEKGLQYELTRKDGAKIYVEASVSLMKDEENQPIGFRGILRDITERKLAEEEKSRIEDQLQKARKMESLGLMAGGIAHDLNNILSGIVSYPELLLMDIPVDSPMRKPMETIKESGMRAVDVVSDLLTIARGVATAKEALNLNTIVAEYLGSAEHQKLERTRSFIDFKAELNPDLLNLNGSSTHMKNTLMNLVMNASEAIEGAGTVTISTTNRYLDEPLKGYEDVRIGEYAVLSVSDDGSGISAEDLEKIFEPFYTKKVMGRSGTGLGLAVVWNTVQDHNGYIDVKSSEKGTVFELYFPVTRDQIAEDKEDVPVAEYQGHGERILVVDDEERQREIACGMLTKLGYIAEAVSSGEEAIEYVKEHPVDLIVLDMVMPKGINGRETYEEIIKIRPGQKAIIASGYAKTKEVETAQELGAGNYIKKPYTMEKVGLAVKVELEK